jgi:hypothetical protein
MKAENKEINGSILLEKFRHDIKTGKIPVAIREAIIKIILEENPFPDWTLRAFI